MTACASSLQSSRHLHRARRRLGRAARRRGAGTAGMRQRHHLHRRPAEHPPRRRRRHDHAASGLPHLHALRERLCPQSRAGRADLLPAGQVRRRERRLRPLGVVEQRAQAIPGRSPARRRHGDEPDYTGGLQGLAGSPARSPRPGLRSGQSRVQPCSQGRAGRRHPVPGRCENAAEAHPRGESRRRHRRGGPQHGRQLGRTAWRQHASGHRSAGADGSRRQSQRSDRPSHSQRSQARPHLQLDALARQVGICRLQDH